jgi:hypothetical protein
MVNPFRKGRQFQALVAQCSMDVAWVLVASLHNDMAVFFEIDGEYQFNCWREIILFVRKLFSLVKPVT